MKLHKIFKTTKWSGGSTTELFIYPKNTTLKNLDFQFRLSTATIEVAKSTFTPLPSVHRHLMMLEGDITLEHFGQHSTKLLAFEQDHFEGDWHTESLGTGVDFNLMFRDPSIGQLRHINLTTNNKIQLDKANNAKSFFVYIHSGQIQTSVGNETFILNPCELIELDEERLDIKAKENSDLIVVEIQLS